jgi:hypothetical protein
MAVIFKFIRDRDLDGQGFQFHAAAEMGIKLSGKFSSSHFTGNSTLLQTHEGIDQGHMRKGLWKVPDQTLMIRVIFLGQQTDIIRDRQNALHQLQRIIHSSLQKINISQPERTGDEGAFTRG